MRPQNHYNRRNLVGDVDDDEQSRVFYELSSLVLSLIRSPNSPISSLSDHRNPNRSQISPSGFASLLLGISCALMLCGSVTFFIGFILMPWVIGFLMLFYFIGMLSYISMLGRAIFYQAMLPVSQVSSPKEIPCSLMRESWWLVTTVWVDSIMHVSRIQDAVSRIFCTGYIKGLVSYSESYLDTAILE